MVPVAVEAWELSAGGSCCLPRARLSTRVLLRAPPQVIKGFDSAVTGLAVGESRKARVPPEDAASAQHPAVAVDCWAWAAHCATACS